MAENEVDMAAEQDKPVQSIAMKTPAFIDSNVLAWFSIMEAQFSIMNIKQPRQKFYHILASLPTDIVGKLQNSILESKDFDKLKDAVINQYEKSKPEMLDKLMSSSIMTGRPSIYLNELMSLAGRIGVGEDIVRHKFIQALPHSIKPVVAAQIDLDLERLGKMSDDLLLYFNRQEATHIQQISWNQNHRNQSDDGSQRKSNPSQKSYNCPNGVRPFNKDQRPKICRSHLYFAERAKYCKPWCKWPDKRNVQMQPSSRPASPAFSKTSEN